MEEILAELREIKEALQAIASSLEREDDLTVGIVISDGHSNDLVVKDCEKLEERSRAIERNNFNIFQENKTV